MSYFNYPKISFSGRYKASPSTINNTPNNFDPSKYPTPNELQNVELYWNPRGDGGFELLDCVVTRVDYADGSFSVDSSEDSIIGQPVASVKNAAFPLAAGLVDLDPMQQNVSEIWGMSIQIGGVSPQANLIGRFTAASFAGIWQQAQGPNAPHSSAAGSAYYQSTLSNLRFSGDPGSSRFLSYFAANPDLDCSINFNVNAHNNAPPIFRFNNANFKRMKNAQKPVPQTVLDKIEPMKNLAMMLPDPCKPDSTGSAKGDIPAKDFVLFMLAQYLSIEEYNANVDTILEITAVLPYVPYGPEDFLNGLITGSVGPVLADEPTLFVPNRMMNPPVGCAAAFYAPFVVSDDGRSIQLNLGNSLCTDNAGVVPWQEKLGDLTLVAFPNGTISTTEATVLATIDYASADFIQGRAGVFSSKLNMDCRQVPLGVLSSTDSGISQTIVLAEQPQGYYLRADKFVFRMNPGIPTTPEFPRGETATAKIYALKFGQPVPDGTEVFVTMMKEQEAETYTVGTLGTSGTQGVKKLSIPQEALTINGQNYTATASTVNGVATIDFSCVAPNNPRVYVDGQIYFLNYGFADPAFRSNYIQDVNDIISIQVYDQTTTMQGSDILNKFGRLYKIMNFLTDDKKVLQIDRRNMIKLLLEKPITELEHMPVTRDLGEAARRKIIDWINHLNSN